MAKRVMMIGLDGASPYLIERWQDELPNLGRLMREGTFGVLESTMPHYTLPAWQSMLTGVNPGKLRIFGFRRRLRNSYRFGFSTLSNSSALTVWDVLAHEDRPSAVIGLPGTFPPQELHGIMVSGFPAPANDGQITFTYPEALSRELDHRFGRYELQVYESYQPGKEQEFIDACRRVGRIHWDAATWLAETQAWAFLAIVSLTIDRASHYFWRFMDSTHPDHDPDEAKQWDDTIRDFYRLEDEYIGHLLDIVDDDLILVTSDHGFCARHRVFFVNEWLRRNGYLHLKRPVTRQAWLGRLMEPVVRLYQRQGWARRLMAPLRRTAARDRLMAAHHAYRHGRLRFEDAPIDWGNTVAYAADQHRIYLNLQGRDPCGTVEPDAYDDVLAQIEQDLAGLADEQGRPIPAQVYRGRVEYGGPFVEQGPDLLLFLDRFHCDLSNGLGGDRITGPSRRLSGTHHPDGTLIVHGPGVHAGHRLQAEIVDIAPTILHALEAPIPAASDGQPIWDAFEEQSAFGQRPVRTITSTGESHTEHTWSEEEESQIMDRLRDLGYV